MGGEVWAKIGGAAYIELKQSFFGVLHMADINLMKVRTGSADIVMAGDEVNQTLTLTNRSDYDISNIYIKDTFSDGITFKANSLQVNGTSAAVNPVSGFNMTGTIKAGNSATVTYRVIIDADTSQQNFSIFSTITFTADSVEYTQNSNTYSMQMARGEMQVVTTPSQNVVTKNQTLGYQSTISNTGNLRQMNIVFKNPIPDGTRFVDGSVVVGGETKSDYDPESGFSLGSLSPGEKITVLFNVKIN